MTPDRNVYNNWTELQKAIEGGGKIDTYTKTEIDTKLAEKQHTLTAGTNIIINDNIISARTDDFVTKTYVDTADNTLQTNINNEVQVRSNADTTLQANINNEITNRTIADNELQENIDKKQDKLTAGTGIELTDNVIKATLIDDDNKSTIKTYSSEKIQALLDALSGRATIKVVDAQPATPEANTLYYVGTASPYEIRLYSENTWYDMGTTEIDLSSYYKKTETYSQEQVDDKVTFLQTAITTEKEARSDKDTTLQENIDKKQDKFTTKEGLKLENNELSVDLSTIVDKLYPIGYVIVANQAPGLGTWTDITDSYSSRYLRLGSYGELSEEALPVPDLTLENAGNHTHERGTMEITGNAGAFVCDASSYISGTGAFYVSGTPRTRSWSGASGNEIRSFGFKASNSWTGATSETGEHTHTISAAAGGVYQDGAAVQPLGFGIRIFQRTA